MRDYRHELSARESSRQRLLIFSKVPTPGGSKTRLVPPLSAREASDLARAFLLDALETLSELPGIDPWLYLTVSSGDLRELEESIPELFVAPLARRITLRMQSGADLGERLLAAFDDAFADGATAACAIGSDHPTLPVAYIHDAFSALSTVDLTIGPADDGGYYLIGMRRLLPGILLGLPYSTSGLFGSVMEIAAAEGLSSLTLAPWYDVDDAASLERLRAERGSLPEGSRTARMLDLLEKRIQETGTEARVNR